MRERTSHSVQRVFAALCAPLVLVASQGFLTLAPGRVDPITLVERDRSSKQQPTFVPAGLVSASDTQYPLQVVADGIVVFNVALNAQGKIAKVSTLINIPGLTEVARSSLRSWKFRPASLDGTNEASQILVAFVFRHAVKTWNPPPFTPVSPSNAPSGYAAPGISSAVYAEYPISTIASGAVVLQVGVRPDGSTGAIKVVRPMAGGFVKLAAQAARQWTFQPASQDGTAVASNIAIAFVFSSRALNPF